MSKYKRRFGDRKEGRLLRSLPAFAKFVPFIMPTRNDACNQYEESFEVSDVDRRLRKLRVDGYKGIGILHFIIAAYIRGVSMLPGMNRFVVGRRIYARDNIEVVMTVKRSLAIDATETTIKVVFEPTDTIFDVYRKMSEKIDEIKTVEGNNNTEDVAEAMCKAPRFLLRFALTILRIMDYFGWLPQSLLDASPFHGSMIITDLGSLRIGPIYHHIYNFGSVTLFFGMGTVEKIAVVEKGEARMKRFLPIGITADERVCSGAHYAAFFGTMSYLLNHPEELEKPPESVRFDEKCEYHVPKVGEQPAKKQKKQQKATVQA